MSSEIKDPLGELRKGGVTQEEREKCVRVCRDYLDGSWTDVAIETLVIKRIV